MVQYSAAWSVYCVALLYTVIAYSIVRYGMVLSNISCVTYSGPEAVRRHEAPSLQRRALQALDKNCSRCCLYHPHESACKPRLIWVPGLLRVARLGEVTRVDAGLNGVHECGFSSTTCSHGCWLPGQDSDFGLEAMPSRTRMCAGQLWLLWGHDSWAGLICQLLEKTYKLTQVIGDGSLLRLLRAFICARADACVFRRVSRGLGPWSPTVSDHERQGLGGVTWFGSVVSHGLRS